MRSSVLNYPERGPWGENKYPGNCSGHIVYALLDWFKPRLFIDPMEGGGTSRAVAQERGIPYVGLDLKDGFDLVGMPLPDKLQRAADLVFVHPPYWNIIRYSGRVWGEATDPRDLSAVAEYEDYLQLLRRALRHAASMVAPSGRLAILIGDIRRRGTYYSPQAEVLRWAELGELEAILIKAQHHCRSDGQRYAGRFIPIRHEYLLIIRKA